MPYFSAHRSILVLDNLSKRYWREFTACVILIVEVLTIGKKELECNRQITDSKVRVIGNEGDQLGIMSAAEALKIAESRGLDLVKIAPNGNPPVCKIMNYGKFKFKKAKKEKEARKNQKTTELKEIRMSLNIDVHDYQTKLKAAHKFLAAGNKVKVSVRFRGREMSRKSLGNELIKRFLSDCSEFGACDKSPKLEGRILSAVISKQTQTNKKQKGGAKNAKS